jgi:hypothetical protein
MPYKVIDLTCESNHQNAGKPFFLTVKLDRPVQESEVRVSLEQQRLILSDGGFPELRPTGGDYFDLNPKFVTVKSGSQSGTSSPVQVKKNPKGGEGDPPVAFPEQLVFSAIDFGVPQAAKAFRSVLVLIEAAKPVASRLHRRIYVQRGKVL